MSKIEGPARPDLLKATDAEIEDAIKYADPMALRGLVYQLTGDEELKDIALKTVLGGYLERNVIAREEDVAMVRRKAADFLKGYRDSGAGPIDIGPEDRLPVSLGLMRGEIIPEDSLALAIEETALDPWVRSPQWRKAPDPQKLENFRVVIVGAGMGGLVSALHCKRAGIPYAVIEKNAGVGGTWYENRYPGSRLDSPSRSYTHLFGVDFPLSNPFSPWAENQKYFSWVADFFDLRKDMVFETEVHSLTWDEAAGEWEIITSDKHGEQKVLRANAVMTSVGFLNRPRLPDIEGRETFAGEAWHTVEWPDHAVIKDKRVAVIGTGATGYQTVPAMALEAAHVTVFQRTPQWLFPSPGYLSPFNSNVYWLNRNFPFFTNFMRLGSGSAAAFEAVSTIDPDFDDPHCCSASNKIARCRHRLPGEQDQGPGTGRQADARTPGLVGAADPGRPGILFLRCDPARQCRSDQRGNRADQRKRDRDQGRQADRRRCDRLCDRLPRQRIPVPDEDHRARRRDHRGVVEGWRRARLSHLHDAGLPQPFRDLRAQHQRFAVAGELPRAGRLLRDPVYAGADPGGQIVGRGETRGLLAVRPPDRRAQQHPRVERSQGAELLLVEARPLGDDEPVARTGNVGPAAQAGV
jgi:hypothetical protein